MDGRHILGGIGVVFIALLIGTTVIAGDTPVNDPEFTINCQGNWTDLPEANESRICTDLSNTDLANTSVSTTITDTGVSPYEVQAQRGELIVVNNTRNETVTIDWEDPDSGSNVTIAPNAQLQFVARGIEYAYTYSESRQGNFRIDAADHGILMSLFTKLI